MGLPPPPRAPAGAGGGAGLAPRPQRAGPRPVVRCEALRRADPSASRVGRGSRSPFRRCGRRRDDPSSLPRRCLRPCAVQPGPPPRRRSGRHRSRDGSRPRAERPRDRDDPSPVHRRRGSRTPLVEAGCPTLVRRLARSLGARHRWTGGRSGIRRRAHRDASGPQITDRTGCVPGFRTRPEWRLRPDRRAAAPAARALAPRPHRGGATSDADRDEMTGMRGDRRERFGVPNGSTTEPERAPRHIPAAWLVGITVGLFLLIALPVVVHGAPLADDYLICLRPVNEGYGSYLTEIWHDTGVVRPTRFIELALISEACRSLPFGAIILVPLALKFVVAFLLYRLLRDMRLPAPWPEIGSAVWLLEPLGTEAALWPSAIHVHFGLALALLALLLYRRDRIGWAAVATLGACLSIEQVIFAMPLAVWLTTPTPLRRRAAMAAGGVVVAVLVAYTLWPGSNPRQALTLAERLHNALDKGEWYLFFPAVGLGLHSGVLGFVWAFPYSVAAVVAGGVAGASAMPGLLSGHRALPVDRRTVRSSALAVALLVFLVNLPLIVTEVGYSARTFTPTWLVLSATATIGGAHVRWERARLLGALAGTAAAFAVVSPAPLGAFHLHEFVTESPTWIQYYTGRRVEIRRSGLRYWGSRCPDLNGADLVIEFPQLVHELTDP